MTELEQRAVAAKAEGGDVDGEDPVRVFQRRERYIAMETSRNDGGHRRDFEK